MKNLFSDLTRYLSWKERFLEDYRKISQYDLQQVKQETQIEDERLLKALVSMYVGGMEHRVKDDEIKYWTNWAGIKTYETFNGFPGLSDVQLSFLFYAVGKIFVPLLLHERGVKSQTFKALDKQSQEKAVMDELEVIWENYLIRILQVLEYLKL